MLDNMLFEANSRRKSTAMKDILKFVFVTLTAVSAMVLPAFARSVRITLVCEGRPNATIVTAKEPSPAAKLASLELQHHVQKITGAVLPIRTDEEQVSGIRILVGESEQTRMLGLKGTDFHPQEYLIRLAPNTIVLIGRDSAGPEASGQLTILFTSPESYRVKIDYAKAIGEQPASEDAQKEITLPGFYDDQGTCYAAYDFLERFCGVRWYGPTDDLMSCPKLHTLTVRGRDVRRSPGMKYRFGPMGRGPILNGQWGSPSSEALNLYWRRLRAGGEKWGANHSFSSFYDRFYKKNPACPELFEGEHPEFFAKGRTGDQWSLQLCYTNPELIRQVVRDARDYFDGKGVKGKQVAIGDYFALVPLDNASWCKCDSCQALLAKDVKNIRGDHFSSGVASHYWFNFVNAVAREVRKTHPNKYIATLAYHVYAYKPLDMEIEPNVSVAPCLQIRNYWAPKIEANEMFFYKQWVEGKYRPIYLWNYYCFPEEIAINGKWHCFPGFSAHRMARQIKMYYADGVRGVFLCGIGEQVDFYLTMKLYDNPTADPDAILSEFFSRYFGAASEPMKRFYGRIEEIFSDPKSYPQDLISKETQLHQTKELAWKYLGNEHNMAELGALIDEAERLARTETEKRHVQLWKTGVWDYMKAGQL